MLPRRELDSSSFVFIRVPVVLIRDHSPRIPPDLPFTASEKNDGDANDNE